LPKLFQPRSVIRGSARSFVVADTYNDRVLEFDEAQNLISGVGSINYEASKLFPISAVVDIRTGILYLVWSQRISFAIVDVGKMTLQTSSQQIKLIKDFDKILGLTTSELQSVGAEGQIMPIHLSSQNAGLAQQLPTTGSFLSIDGEALSTGFDSSSKFYQSVVSGLGLPVFSGNFAYIDGIFTPTYAEKTNTGGFVIANATVAVKEYTFPTEITEETITLNSNVSNIIELDRNNNIIFGSNIMEFSPFVPGRTKKISNNTLLIGGLKKGGKDGSPTTEDPFNFRSISGNDETKSSQKRALSQILFGGSIPHVGAVVILDTKAGATTFQYTSAEGIVVSDVDIDPNSGEYVVAESSLQKSGRIIKLDSSGNIVFSFGSGLYSLINDVYVQIDSSIVIST